MSASSEIAPEKNTKSLAGRVGWILLICATLYTCYFWHLGAIGLLGPDEPRYAWIAREMAQSGDWVTPRLYGKAWFEKPPLYYWGAALSFKLFGVSDAAARLPSAMLALLATLALAWLAWRLYGAETARCLLILLPTTIGMIGFSHAAAPDMPFAATLTLTIVCAAVVLQLVPDLAMAQHAEPSQRTRELAAWKRIPDLLFGIFLGLTVLAKGPAGIVLAGGATFLWALATTRWRNAFRLLHPVAVATFCITALPWYILCARRNPDFFRIFIIEHNFKRYLTPEFQHIQPFWFYVPVLLVAVLPWTFVLLPAAADLSQSLHARRDSGATILFFTSWALFPLLFFSFSQSKLPGYILPAIPPLIFLCGGALVRRLDTKFWPVRILLTVTSVVALVMIVGGFAYSVGLRGLYNLQRFAEHEPVRVWLFALAGLACLAAAVLAIAGRLRPSGLCIVAALVVFVASAKLARLDEALSPRETCRELIRAKAPDEEIVLCKVPRSYTYGINFYLEREIPEWSLRDPAKRALVIIGSPACWSDLVGVNYRLRSELNTRWPVIQLEPSASGLPGGGQSQ